jgi:hypothetical protein
MTLGNDEFPCFLCGEKRELRQSKKAKPYFICDPCGVQAFIRKDAGVRKLQDMQNPLRRLPKKVQKPNKVLEIIQGMDDLKQKLAEIENEGGIRDFFISDETRELQKAALLAEIKKAELRLNKCLK